MQLLLDYLHLSHPSHLLVAYLRLSHLNHLDMPVSPRTCHGLRHHRHRQPDRRSFLRMRKMKKNMIRTSTQHRDLAFQLALFPLEKLVQTILKIMKTICIRHLHDHILFHTVRELFLLHIHVKSLFLLHLLRGLVHHHLLMILLLHQPLEYRQGSRSTYKELKDQAGDLQI
jgi:hypothetical protein